MGLASWLTLSVFEKATIPFFRYRHSLMLIIVPIAKSEQPSQSRSRVPPKHNHTAQAFEREWVAFLPKSHVKFQWVAFLPKSHVNTYAKFPISA